MSNKMLFITANTVIKLYVKYEWEGLDQSTICTNVIDEILTKLNKPKSGHPLTKMFSDEEDHSSYYELIHFVFCTIETYVKDRPKFTKKS